MWGDSFEHYVEIVRDRIERPELWRRFPTGWAAGKQGGPSWMSSPEHVRLAEPRFYARRMSLFSFAATARFHYAVGDQKLRRISIVVDPISTAGHGPPGPLVAPLLNFASHATSDQLGGEPDGPSCRVSAELCHSDTGPEVVIDIVPVIPPPDESWSMEAFFIYDD